MTPVFVLFHFKIRIVLADVRRADAGRGREALHRSERDGAAAPLHDNGVWGRARVLPLVRMARRGQWAPSI